MGRGAIPSMDKWGTESLDTDYHSNSMSGDF